MFSRIYLNNFKVFNQQVEFTNLKSINVITGINGRGKSTFLQVLLLIKQTILRNPRSLDILLNGDLISLGTAGDVINASSNDKNIVFGYDINDYSIHYILSYDDYNSQVLKIDIVHIADQNGDILFPYFIRNNNEVKTDLFNLIPTNIDIISQNIFKFDRIQYIPAERIGPRNFYPMNTLEDDYIGHNCEFSVFKLLKDGENILNDNYFEELDSLLYDDNIKYGHTIHDQVNLWMSLMFGKTSISAKYNKDINVAYFNVCTEYNNTNVFFKSEDVGYGFTYSLPILVAGLTAKSGDTIIVENPEAHLHPAAQSVIGKFLGLISKLNIQVFVETHSEHIINALRIMVAQNVVRNTDVNIMYFDNSYKSFYKSVYLGKRGEIDEWPDGFFDQTEKDLNIILGL